MLRKALARGLTPIVIINKIDRTNSRPKEVLDEVYGLFIELGAHDHQLEFPVIYASGRQGRAGFTVEGGPNLAPILDTILEKIPRAQGGPRGRRSTSRSATSRSTRTSAASRSAASRAGA